MRIFSHITSLGLCGGGCNHGLEPVYIIVNDRGEFQTELCLHCLLRFQDHIDGVAYAMRLLEPKEGEIDWVREGF